MGDKTRRTQSSPYLKPTMFDFKLISFMFTIFVNCVDPFGIMRRFIVTPAMTSMTSVYEDYKEKALDKLDGSQSVILRIFVISTIGFLLLCGAILLYVLFYIMYMPTSTYVKPVFLQYDRICDEKNCDLASTTSPFHSFPRAHIQLARHQQMMVGQPYHITVRMRLPETPRNKDLGVFMVCVDMKDKENVLKSNSCRSTMLKFQSPWLAYLKTILLLPFYILGMREELQEVEVEMFNRYVDTTNSVTDIYFEIQSKVIEFYSVTFHITAHFTGLRYLIFNFPTISAIVGIAVNFFLLVAVALITWYHYDYEMEWLDDARRKFTGRSSPPSNKESSISTTTESPSMIEYIDSDRLEDDGFLFDDSESDEKSRMMVFEE